MTDYKELFVQFANSIGELQKNAEELTVLYDATYRRLKLRDSMIAKLEEENLLLKQQIAEYRSGAGGK